MTCLLPALTIHAWTIQQVTQYLKGVGKGWNALILQNVDLIVIVPLNLGNVVRSLHAIET